MARLHEYQGKALLAHKGIPIPQGRAAGTPDEARQIAAEIGGPVVVKMQAWVTGSVKSPPGGEIDSSTVSEPVRPSRVSTTPARAKNSAMRDAR